MTSEAQKELWMTQTFLISKSPILSHWGKPG